MVTWLAAFTLFALYSITGRGNPSKSDKFKLWLHNVRAVVLIAAICTLIAAPMSWFGAGALGQVLGGWIGSIIGMFTSNVALVVGAAVFLLLIFAGWDIARDKKVDKQARMACIAIPILVMAPATGPFATAADSVVSNVQNVTASIPTVLFS